MSLHQFDFNYIVREQGSIEMDIDTNINKEDAYSYALEEIMQDFPDIEEVKITEMRIVQ